MKTSILLASAVALVQAGPRKPVVTSEALQALINIDDLLAGEQQLQDFAYAYPPRNRVFGGQAHNDTVNYLYDTIAALNYYDVYFQPFEALYSAGDASFIANGVDQEALLFTYTPSGNISAPVIPVNNLGCEESDFPPEVEGNIALISRGSCTFAIKSTNALAAGAAGAVVYNNVEGTIAGTLGGEGDYVPTAGITQAAGEALLALVAGGTTVNGVLVINSIMENRTTYNVIAETKGGDHNNVIMAGAHTDSVEAGPGINDDGSGTIGILDVAIALSNFKVKNAVRFGWWSAEEFGLLGSEYYVTQLNQTPSELAKIRAYLNFDMIASPNYIYAIYDGNGDAFNLSGPPGSAAIETRFEDFFMNRDLNFTATAFDGRSDYGPFLDVGIAAGGLFTGAEEIKTEEEVTLFGGEAGVAYDVNYHQAGDTIGNLSTTAFLVNTQAIADSIATYAVDLSSIPVRNGTAPTKRSIETRKLMSNTVHKRHGLCSHAKETI